MYVCVVCLFVCVCVCVYVCMCVCYLKSLGDCYKVKKGTLYISSVGSYPIEFKHCVIVKCVNKAAISSIARG